MSSAANLTNSILLAISERYGRRVKAWRSNRVNAMVPLGGGQLRMVKAGIDGQADITGIGPGGVRIEIEVKAGKDRMRKSQHVFAANIRECGGVYIEGKSVEQVMTDLQKALAGKQ